MKKIVKSIIVILFLSLFLYSCVSDIDSKTTKVVLRFINQETSVNPDTSLAPNEVQYKILDNTIVSVSNTGILKALKEGETKVEITYKGKVETVEINVLNGKSKHEDLVYKDAFKLDIIEPSYATYKKSPVIVFVHGGFWAQGSKADLSAETQGKTYKELSELGITVVSIDYRLADSSANTFPKNIEDVKDAIRYLRVNANTYNIDPNNIGLWGTSAGAHLALMAAYTNDDEFATTTFTNISSKVNYVVAINPVFDLIAIMDDIGTSTQDKVKYAKALFNLDYNNLTQSDKDTINTYFPVKHMKKGLVPTLLFHGKEDHTVPVTQSKALETELKKFSNTVELHLYDNTDHGLVKFNVDPKKIDSATMKDVNEKTTSFVLANIKK